MSRFRKTIEVTFDEHVFIRQAERKFDIDFAIETVRTGSIVEEKSSFPRKVCFSKYEGKERQTYVVIALIHKDSIEVKTVWLRQGR